MSQNGFYDAVAYAHKLFAVCGHCGKRQCAGRSGHSILPGRITMTADQLLEIIRRAAAEQDGPR